MTKLRIDMTNLEDLRVNAVNRQQPIDGLINQAADVIRKGGQVVIERRFSNAPTEELQEFATIETFKDFWNQFFNPKENH